MFGFHYQLMEPGNRSGVLNLLTGENTDKIALKIGPLGIAATVLSFILWAALVTLLVLLVIYFIKRIKQGGGATGPVSAPDRGTSSGGGKEATMPGPAPELLRLLDERYAKGEIDHDDYMLRKTNLLGLKMQGPGQGTAEGQEASDQPPQNNPGPEPDQPGR